MKPSPKEPLPPILRDIFVEFATHRHQVYLLAGGRSCLFEENPMRKALISFAAATAILLFAQLAPADPVPAMPWLHVGTTVVVKWYTAKMFSQSVTFTQDGNGNWIGSDGKNYDMQINQSMDAGGLNQNTVIAIDGDKIVLKWTKFMASATGDPERNSPDAGGEPRYIADAAKNVLGESPDLLAKEVSDPSAGKIVSHVQWPAAGHLVDAIRIDKLSQHEWLSVVFDAKTGIGLHLADVSSGGDSGTQFMSSDILECRDLQVPWINEGMPESVRNLKSMRLSGQVASHRAFAGRPVGYAIDYTMDQCTDNWAQVDVVGSALGAYGQPIPGKPETRYYGPGELDGLWIGPDAAAKLAQGQVLDEDPYTKIKTVVTFATDQQIAITQSNSQTTSVKIYDRATGLLTGSDWYDALTESQTTLRRLSQ
jgi:hypothetical protein